MKQANLLKKHPTLALIALLLAALACSLTNKRTPQVNHHPQPDLSVESSIFEDVGCPLVNGFQRCHPDSPLTELGCQMIRNPSGLLGGLEPAYPLYICLTRPTSPSGSLPENEYIYSEGCLLRNYISYVIWKDEQFQLVRSQNDLQKTFAPIEAEAEAISYAIAATGLNARYGIETQRGYRYFVDRLEDTHVNRTSEGFIVSLFDYRLCGCGPHPTYSAEVLVRPNGQWEELNRVKLFEDPEQDNLCVD